MRILLGFLVVLLLATPSHAYLPTECRDAHAALDYAEATDIVVGQVAGFDRLESIEKHKKLNGEEDAIRVFEYFAKVKIGRTVKGELKVGQEIRVFEGYGEEYSGDSYTESHSIKQCNTHLRAGMQLGTAYIFALNCKPNADVAKTFYGFRSCHSSLHEIENVQNEESGKEWHGVKINEDEKRGPHYVTVDAYIDYMKKRSAENAGTK